MVTYAIWWLGNGLLALIMFRALLGRFVARYPLFYIYISWMLMRSLAGFFLYKFVPHGYQVFYWYTEFFTVSLGYCVIWEIFAQVFADHRGVARLSKVLLSVIFAAIVIKVVAGRLGGSVWPRGLDTAELELDLRVVQAVLFVVVVGLVVYYSIPVGRNLRSLMAGYGFFVSVALLQLTALSRLGEPFQAWWHYLEPAAYDATLVVWCVGLWSYAPNPRTERLDALEADYGLLVSNASMALARVRRYVLRVVR